MGGDLVHPGAEGDVVVKYIQPPCAQLGLLHDVFGILQRAEHPVAVHEKFAVVRLREAFERLLVPSLRRAQVIDLIYVHHLLTPAISRNNTVESYDFSYVSCPTAPTLLYGFPNWVFPF
jgi:hypothetical protein